MRAIVSQLLIFGSLLFVGCTDPSQAGSALKITPADKTQITTSPTNKPTKKPGVTPSISPATPTKSVTSLPTPTRELDDSRLRLYRFAEFGVYNYLEQNSDTFSNNVPTLSSFGGEAANVTGPGNASTLSFSHFSDRIAYWTHLSLDIPIQFWISDLDYQTPRLIGSGDQILPGQAPEDINLSWSPDDRYVFIRSDKDVKSSLIYSIEDASLESWPFECSLIAFSPRSSKLATWCKSVSAETSYAVLDWDGEIWYTDEEPHSVLVSQRSISDNPRMPQLSHIWGWSSDGTQIAYIDPEDDLGQLHIVRSSGEEVFTGLPGIGDWVNHLDTRITVPKQPLQWSQNGQRLLIHGSTNGSFKCPNYRNLLGPEPINLEAPCWQVVDLASSEVIWAMMDSATDLMTPADPTMIEEYLFPLATISGDGRYLALAGSLDGNHKLAIIDVDDNSLVYDFSIYSSALRWDR